MEMFYEKNYMKCDFDNDCLDKCFIVDGCIN